MYLALISMQSNIKISEAELKFGTVPYLMSLKCRKLGESSVATVKISSKIFLLFPWHGYSVSNDLDYND